MAKHSFIVIVPHINGKSCLQITSKTEIANPYSANLSTKTDTFVYCMKPSKHTMHITF